MDISEVEETLFMIGDAKVHTQHILNTCVFFYPLFRFSGIQEYWPDVIISGFKFSMKLYEFVLPYR